MTFYYFNQDAAIFDTMYNFDMANLSDVYYDNTCLLDDQAIFDYNVLDIPYNLNYVQPLYNYESTAATASTLNLLEAPYVKLEEDNQSPLDYDIQPWSPGPYSPSLSSYSSLSDKESKKSKEQAKKQFQCNLCTRSFARKYDVVRHKRIHTGSKPYECPCCHMGFSRSDARVRHFRKEEACREGASKIKVRSSPPKKTRLSYSH